MDVKRSEMIDNETLKEVLVFLRQTKMKRKKSSKNLVNDLLEIEAPEKPAPYLKTNNFIN